MELNMSNEEQENPDESPSQLNERNESSPKNANFSEIRPSNKAEDEKLEERDFEGIALINQAVLLRQNSIGSEMVKDKVAIRAMTWTRESYGLFDYESRNLK